MVDISKKGWFLPVIVAIVGFLGALVSGYLSHRATLTKLERETRERVNQAIIEKYVDGVINSLYDLYEEIADKCIILRSPEENPYHYLFLRKNMPVEKVKLNSDKKHESFVEFRKKAHELIFLDETIKRAFIRQAFKMAYESLLKPGYYFLGAVDVYEIDMQVKIRKEEGIGLIRLEKYLTLVDWGARFMQRNLTIIKEHIITTSFESNYDFLTRYKDDNLKNEEVQHALNLLNKYYELEKHYYIGDENPLFIFLKIYFKYKEEDYFSREYLEVLDCALKAYKKNRNIVHKFYGMTYVDWNKDEFLKEMSCVEMN